MKKTFLLNVCLVSLCTCACSQPNNDISLVSGIEKEFRFNKIPGPGFTPGNIASTFISPAKLVSLYADHAVSYVDIKTDSRALISYNFTNNFSFTDKNKFTGFARKRTNLLMLVTRIFCLFDLVKSNNIGALKLSTQKTVFGISARACKKVRGLTFCVPVGY